MKDQSYALWALSQTALSKTMFPLGELDKQTVRELARKYGLRNAEKDESFEICFVADNDYERFLKERVPGLQTRVAEGALVRDGTVVGTHNGYPFYTIGQRRGIGAHGRPMYVTGVDGNTNTVHIGSGEELLQTGLLARGVNLVGRGELVEGMEVEAKVRYKDEAARAKLYPSGDSSVRVVFDKPKRAITPGQSVVFYDGEDLVGGGVIDAVLA